MARKRRTQAVTVYRAPAARVPAPIIRVSAPRAVAPHKSRRRSRGGSVGGGGSLQKRMVNVAIGGAALGFVERSQIAIPTIPVLGRTGTIAVAAYFLGGQRPGLLQDVALAAATMAGYQLGRDGKVSGEEDV